MSLLPPAPPAPPAPPVAPATLAHPHLPVTVLTGYAGAGKTTLLRHLLRQQPPQRTAVIISHDSLPAAQQVGAADGDDWCIRTEEKVVQLATERGRYALRADLLREAGRLARENCHDYLLLENPALADVETVVRTFQVGHLAYGLDLPHHARLDTLVAVVDAGRFFTDWHAPVECSRATGAVVPTPWFRADVLAAQVEAANVVVLNKTDQAGAAELARLRAFLHQLNPKARLLAATFGQVTAAELLHTGLYRPAAPVQETAPIPAGDFSRFCFRDARPFHPERLWQLVREAWPAAVLRSRGLFWLASRPEPVLRWDQAGPSRRAATVGRWWAAVPDRAQNPAFQREELALLARWHPEFQDRVNTLHFIGEDLDHARLRADLEACLCTPLEVGRWRRGAIFPDPWPQD
jgi:G3E family GTPase